MFKSGPIACLLLLVYRMNSAEETVPEIATLMEKAISTEAEVESEGKDDGMQTMEATHFWDCNGGSCDAPILQPWKEAEYVFPPQYAPADPEYYGGAAYGERLWMTGAASDALSDLLGPDREGCGYSTKGGGGCGKCVLVRNPTARNPDWSAVVMKKSRCPPESPGCRSGVHMDLAVPGFDLLRAKLPNVCGKQNRRDTFITEEQAGICASTPAHACNCSGIPDDTPERKMLRKGCELFKAWGWHHGTPLLNYRPVECPPRFVERVRIGKAFSASGIVSQVVASRHTLQPGMSAATRVAASGVVLLAAASLVLVRHYRAVPISEALAPEDPQDVLEVGASSD